jgi:hypothetical protein
MDGSNQRVIDPKAEPGNAVEAGRGLRVIFMLRQFRRGI